MISILWKNVFLEDVASIVQWLNKPFHHLNRLNQNGMYKFCHFMIIIL